MARSLARATVLAAAAAAAMALSSVSCAGGTKVSAVASGADEREKVDRDIRVEVVSHAFRDANVYLHLNGSRRRLGLASGNNTTLFKVPWNAQVSNTVLAHLSAEIVGDDSRVQSSTIQVSSGAHILWTLNNSFVETNLEVY